MVGVSYLLLILNSFIFSFIFWLLTFLAKYTYTNKYYDYKLNFYECGFKNLSKENPQYEINFGLMLLFLLIYDGEFLILLPISLNPNIITFVLVIFLFFFLLWFIITILYDYILHGLDWQV